MDVVAVFIEGYKKMILNTLDLGDDGLIVSLWTNFFHENDGEEGAYSQGISFS